MGDIFFEFFFVGWSIRIFFGNKPGKALMGFFVFDGYVIFCCLGVNKKMSHCEAELEVLCGKTWQTFFVEIWCIN